MHRREFLSLAVVAAALGGCGGGAADNGVVAPATGEASSAASVGGAASVASPAAVIAAARVSADSLDLDVDARNVSYQAMRLDNGLQSRAADGSVRWTLGNTGDDAAQFNRVSGVDEASGHIYGADTGNHRIIVYDTSGALVRVIGPFAAGPSALLYPTDVVVDGARLYVVDSAHHRVAVFSIDGPFEGAFGELGTGPGQLNGPRAIKLVGGLLHVVDAVNGRVNVYTTSGTFTRTYGTRGRGPGLLFNPRDVAVDGAGRCWVADTGHARMVAYSSSGEVLQTFVVTHADGSRAIPIAVTFDAEGRLVISARAA